MDVPGLLATGSLRVFVLFPLFFSVHLPAFLATVSLDNIFDRLGAAARLQPQLAILFMLTLAFGDNRLLLPHRFIQTPEKNAIILQAHCAQATSATGLELPGVLLAISAQLVELPALFIEVLLALPELAHSRLFTALRHALNRLHSF